MRNSMRATKPSQSSRRISGPDCSHTRDRAAARKPRPQRLSARKMKDGETGNDESNLTTLQRTGIVVDPFDTLQDVIIRHCKLVVEDLVEHLLRIDGDEEHRAVDGVISAMALLRAEVYGEWGKASRFTSVSRVHVLPVLQDTQTILSIRKAQWSYADVGAQSSAGVDAVLSKANETVLFFENLIEDVAEHYDNSLESHNAPSRLQNGKFGNC